MHTVTFGSRTTYQSNKIMFMNIDTLYSVEDNRNDRKKDSQKWKKKQINTQNQKKQKKKKSNTQKTPLKTPKKQTEKAEIFMILTFIKR